MKKIIITILVIVIVAIIFELFFLLTANKKQIKKQSVVPKKISVTEEIFTDITPTLTPKLDYKKPLPGNFIEGVTKNLSVLINTNKPLNFILHKYALYLSLSGYKGLSKSRAINEYYGTISKIDYNLTRSRECLDQFALVKQPYTFLIVINYKDTKHQFCFDEVTKKITVNDKSGNPLTLKDLKVNDNISIEIDLNLLETQSFNKGIEFVNIIKQ